MDVNSLVTLLCPVCPPPPSPLHLPPTFYILLPTFLYFFPSSTPSLFLSSRIIWSPISRPLSVFHPHTPQPCDGGHLGDRWMDHIQLRFSTNQRTTYIWPSLVPRSPPASLYWICREGQMKFRVCCLSLMSQIPEMQLTAYWTCYLLQH